MPEKKPTRTADLDYFYGQSSELFSFYRIPKLLFQDSRFQPLSTDAKTLYGILLDRMSLSARNGWLDKAGRVFIIYTVQEVQDSLGCADKKATKLLRELEEYGLIERKRRGLGKPDLIYVKNFSSESSKLRFLNRDNDDSGTGENTFQDPVKLRCNKTERNNTEISDTEALTDEEFAAIYKEAQKYVGTPYVWGGSTPETGFDCSGYVCWVYNQNGYDVGRTTANGLWNKSQHISEAEAKLGDLVFFEGTYDTPGKSHVGIYLGNGMMVSAGDPIKYANIHSSYWEKHLAGFGPPRLRRNSLPPCCASLQLPPRPRLRCPQSVRPSIRRKILMKMMNKVYALVLSVTLCAGMAAPAFSYGGGPVEEAEQPVLTSTTDEEDAVTVTDEETGALTPEGNLTLVDDYHTSYSDGSGHQFITLVSKSGNTFYLVIDRNDKGQQTVHFMNLVDEADLLALMEEEDADAYTAEKEAAAQAEQ